MITLMYDILLNENVLGRRFSTAERRASPCNYIDNSLRSGNMRPSCSCTFNRRAGKCVKLTAVHWAGTCTLDVPAQLYEEP